MNKGIYKIKFYNHYEEFEVYHNGENFLWDKFEKYPNDEIESKTLVGIVTPATPSQNVRDIKVDVLLRSFLSSLDGNGELKVNNDYGLPLMNGIEAETLQRFIREFLSGAKSFKGYATSPQPIDYGKHLELMMTESGSNMVERKPSWGRTYEVIVAQNETMDAFIKHVLPDLKSVDDLNAFIEIYKQRKPSV